MRKSQLNMAAKLYALATMAHVDTGGSETQDQTDVIEQAKQRAVLALAKLDISPGEVASLAQCITVAKELHP